MKLITKVLITAAASAAAVAYIVNKQRQNEEVKIIKIDDLPERELVEVKKVEEKEQYLQQPLPVVDYEEKEALEICQTAVEEETFEEPVIEQVEEEVVEQQVVEIEEPVEEEPALEQTEEVENEIDEQAIEESVIEEFEETIPQEETFEEVKDIIEELTIPETEEFTEQPIETVEQVGEEDLGVIVDALASEQVLNEGLIEGIDEILEAFKKQDEANEIVSIMQQEMLDDEVSETNQEEIIDNADEVIKMADETLEEIQKAIEEVTQEDIPMEPFVDESTLVEENSEVEEFAEIIPEVLDEKTDEEEDEILTTLELVDKYAKRYDTISPNLIASIFKQIGKTQDLVGENPNIYMRHFIVFDNVENRVRFANITSMKGLNTQMADNDTDLFVFDMVENKKTKIIKAVLEVVLDAADNKGTYKGWRIFEN